MFEFAATSSLGNGRYILHPFSVRGRQTTIGNWPGRNNEMAYCSKSLLLHTHCHPTSRRLCITALHSSDNNGNMNNTKPGSSDIISFSSSISTDIPFYEPPGVSFDEYIYDRPRVFRAMFPDEKRSKRLNNEEWRIQMLPLQFLFATVKPVVVMRLLHKSKGEEYPSLVPEHATSILEIQATQWELQGLEGIHIPPHFALGVHGVLYPERSDSRSRLKGHLDMSINMILPQILKLVPEDILKGVADAVLRRLLETMKHEVDASLISDYKKFQREKIIKNRLRTQPPPAPP